LNGRTSETQQRKLLTKAYFDSATGMKTRVANEQIVQILYDFGSLKDSSLLRIKVTFQIFENIGPSR
jgi:hypothetical protein